MDVVVALFGQGRMLGPGQMVLRAIVVFAIALVLIRIAGRRAFGQRSPFDYVVGILLGAILSRAVVGASPFVATVAASFAIALLHRVIGWACVRSRRLERLLVGAEREVYRNGFDDAQMRAALITPTDVHERAPGARRGRPVGRRRGDPGAQRPRQHRAAQPLPKAVTAACGDGCRKEDIDDTHDLERRDQLQPFTCPCSCSRPRAP